MRDLIDEPDTTNITFMDIMVGLDVDVVVN